MTADIAAISRHRIGIDGDGVTTLVAFMMCPLRCRYCLNPQTLSKEYPSKSYTAKELYDEVRTDELYFLATGGGITFGGGEPLLNPEFIKEFRAICGNDWKINVETSLNVPLKTLRELSGVINSFIVDIKDMNPAIYASYTGKDNTKVLENLKYLASAGLSGSCVVRVPLIPDFNTEKDVESSIEALEALGFTKFDKFTYKTKIHGKR